ncbi:MAG: sugar ABC transporter permease [Candidatus Bipolaricaulota bacterium]|nr:sugar ABC transporter permease [Candidatus Bipolaricaulota bacterium]
MASRRSLGWWARRLLRNFLAWVAIAFALFPALFVVGTSFNPTNNLSATRMIPDRPTLVHYRVLVRDYPFLTWLGNTVKVAGITSVVTVFLCALGAYAFSRFRFRGRRTSLLTLLLVQMFPQTLGMVAIFLLLNTLGKHLPWLGVNTHPGLILVYLGGAMGFNTWFMKGYFDTIPRSLEESALVDGATPFQAFVRVVLPLARPILAVVVVIQFITIYSEYLLASILLKGERMYTLSVGLRLFLGDNYRDRWGMFAAGAVLGALLILALFYALQSQIVSGLTGGAVKE